MALANINIQMDAALSEQLATLCDEVGMSLAAAFTAFARKAVRERRIPVEPDARPVPGGTVTGEELLRASRELDAGLGVGVTLKELRALEREPPSGGPVYRELRRRAEEAGA